MPTFGPFELLKRLGGGATAEVHLATGPNSAGVELFALKILLPAVAEDEATRAALVKEGEAVAFLEHPNVVQVYELGEEERRPYLAMELVRGQSLEALVKRMREDGKALSVAESCHVVMQAAQGLDHAHEARLVHRDVNPQNLIVDETGVVKVVDFGLAKATLAYATSTGGLKGKLAYMPPEQIEGKPIDRRADVYALGAVLWELLAGQKLYSGKNEAEILQQVLNKPVPRIERSGLPGELVELVEQALQRDLQRRLPGCGVLADALQPFTTPETQKKLGSRITNLFEPMPRTVAEARERAKASSKPASRPVKASELEAAVKADRARPASRSTEPVAAARSNHAVDADPAPHPVLKERASRSPGGGEVHPALKERAAKPAKTKPPVRGGAAAALEEPRRAAGPAIDAGDTRRDAKAAVRAAADRVSGEKKAAHDSVYEERMQADRAVLINPLLAGRPAHLMPKASAGRDDEPSSPGYRGYGAYPEEFSVSRILRASGKKHRPLMVIAGILVAAGMILLALFAYTRVLKPAAGEDGSGAVSPAPPEAAAPPATKDRPRSDSEAADEPRRSGRTGTVQLQSDVPAFVRHGGKDLGMTPLTVTLPAGVAKLELRTPDGALQTQVTVTVTAGGEITRRVQLKK